jgi:hypothetical protein
MQILENASARCMSQRLLSSENNSDGNNNNNLLLYQKKVSTNDLLAVAQTISFENIVQPIQPLSRFSFSYFISFYFT